MQNPIYLITQYLINDQIINQQLIIYHLLIHHPLIIHHFYLNNPLNYDIKYEYPLLYFMTILFNQQSYLLQMDKIQRKSLPYLQLYKYFHKVIKYEMEFQIQYLVLHQQNQFHLNRKINFLILKHCSLKMFMFLIIHLNFQLLHH